jgi:hypothetical protein
VKFRTKHELNILYFVCVLIFFCSVSNFFISYFAPDHYEKSINCAKYTFIARDVTVIIVRTISISLNGCRCAQGKNIHSKTHLQ